MSGKQFTLRPISYKAWATADRLRAQEIIRQGLNGIGDASEKHWEPGETALHFRRPLTAREEAGIAELIRVRRTQN